MKKHDNAIIERKVSIYFIHKGDNIPLYVGKTKTPFSKRIYSHKLRFGEDILMEEIDKIEEINWKFWEKHYISLFRSWGFKLDNKNNGGGGLNFHSEISKDKIRKKWDNKTKNEKNNINYKRGKGNKGKKKPKSGRKQYTKEQLEYSKKHSRFSQSDWSEKCKKSVLMLDKYSEKVIKEFSSVSEAANFIKVSQSTLSGCLTKHQKTSGGYKWKFKN